ncbi:hypothetical protein [Arthrobacter sp. PAMC 25486]|uniref:hypothetical protein n=1 Tax=Arthrobacter sp. PAMC 25486 TaxID=1494608 RepID=UPI0012FF0959|nr:hypothetical protein [Arthrobacter sp. PAMC 25486]
MVTSFVERGCAAPRRVKDIGSALLLESASLSSPLKRLESLGYLTLTKDTAGERALAIELTSAGAGDHCGSARHGP